MRAAIVDTGPLVAFLNRRDRYHSWAVEQFGSLPPPLLTCEAVLSETAYLVRDLHGGPEAVLELVARGVVSPTFRLLDEIAAVKTVVRRYGRDLADACLVRMSEIHSDCVPTPFVWTKATRRHHQEGTAACPLTAFRLRNTRGLRSR